MKYEFFRLCSQRYWLSYCLVNLVKGPLRKMTTNLSCDPSGSSVGNYFPSIKVCPLSQLYFVCFLTSERREEVPFLRRVRRGKRTGGSPPFVRFSGMKWHQIWLDFKSEGTIGTGLKSPSGWRGLFLDPARAARAIAREARQNPSFCNFWLPLAFLRV